MGHSHKWRNKVDAALAALVFERLVADTKLILISLPSYILIGSGSGEEGSHANITDEFISFNGIGEHGYEDFFVSKEGLALESFSWCKTELKPYDFAVKAVLIRLAHHSGHQISVESDGLVGEWLEALDFCITLFGEAWMPSAIRVRWPKLTS